MKILIRQYLGKNHSWSVCGWGIARALKIKGHQVDLYSTDGIDHLPLDLKENLIGYNEVGKPVVQIDRNLSYDCQISYTAMKNFPMYLANGSKNRFGIWCYEWAGKNALPTGFAKYHRACDRLLAPSVFSKKVFEDSGVPSEKVVVVPHGIDKSQYSQTSTIKLKTSKKFRILANIAQNHKRKNIPGLLKAYGMAFNKNDDVCLIIKGKDKPIVNTFDVSLNDCIRDFKRQFPNHAEMIVMTDFLDDISVLYRSVDCFFTMSHGEGFLFPALESIASGKIVIAPNWGGQLDFLNSSNALLVEGKETKSDPSSMYWDNKQNTIWFSPDVNDAVKKLRFAFKNFKNLNNNLDELKQSFLEEYSWDSVVDKFLALCV